MCSARVTNWRRKMEFSGLERSFTGIHRYVYTQASLSENAPVYYALWNTASTIRRDRSARRRVLTFLRVVQTHSRFPSIQNNEKRPSNVSQRRRFIPCPLFPPLIVRGESGPEKRRNETWKSSILALRVRQRWHVNCTVCSQIKCR